MGWSPLINRCSLSLGSQTCMSSKELDVKYGKIVGVASGTLFPIECRGSVKIHGYVSIGKSLRMDEKYIIE